MCISKQSAAQYNFIKWLGWGWKTFMSCSKNIISTSFRNSYLGSTIQEQVLVWDLSLEVKGRFMNQVTFYSFLQRRSPLPTQSLRTFSSRAEDTVYYWVESFWFSSALLCEQLTHYYVTCPKSFVETWTEARGRWLASWLMF